VEKKWDSSTIKFELPSPEMKIKNWKQALWLTNSHSIDNSLGVSRCRE
jgi:hypothetical protein